MRDDPDAIAIAVDDARARAQAVVDLMVAADQQAVTLLGIYLTVGTATATGAGAAFVGGSKYSIVSMSLLTMTLALFAASVFCFMTMRKVALSNPGRDPDFWLWALNNDGVSLQHAVTSYLEALGGDISANRRVNARSAWYLSVAKVLGLAAPLFGATAGVIVFFTGFTAAWV